MSTDGAGCDMPEGGVFSPKEFLHLGSREAVDQTFTRLVKEKSCYVWGEAYTRLLCKGGSAPVRLHRNACLQPWRKKPAKPW